MGEEEHNGEDFFIKGRFTKDDRHVALCNSYIILPTTFSENVESINSQPQKATIEYAISSLLESKARYAANEGILEAIDSSYKTSLTENRSELDYMKLQNQTVTDKGDAETVHPRQKTGVSFVFAQEISLRLYLGEEKRK